MKVHRFTPMPPDRWPTSRDYRPGQEAVASIRFRRGAEFRPPNINQSKEKSRMITIEIHDKATPALEELLHRLSNRQFILHTTSSGQRLLLPANVAPHTLRIQAWLRSQRRADAPPPPPCVNLGGRIVPTLNTRTRPISGAGLIAGNQKRTLPPAVLHRAWQAASGFVREQIQAVFGSFQAR
jgi:hypothetical protein